MENTSLLYLNDHDIVEANTTILSVGTDSDGEWVVLDRTPFHVHGGGQPADMGTLAGRQVNGVKSKDGQVRHYIETFGLQTGDQLHACVDKATRDVYSAWHSAGHLIAAVAERLWHGLHITNANQHPGQAWIMATIAECPPIDFHSQLNAELTKIVHADLPIVVQQGQKRYVTIHGYDDVPCGGTHAKTTSFLKGLEVSKITHKRGVLRISYLLPT